MLLFVFNRTTMHTEYTVLCETHVDATFKERVSYQKFRMAWHSFIELLDIDYEDGFMCAICGAEPECVIMDATSLSFRRTLASWTNFLNQTDEQVRRRFRCRI